MENRNLYIFYTVGALVLLLVVIFPAFKNSKRSQTSAGSGTYERALRQAKSENKHLMVYFGADWCRYCKQFLNNTLPDKKVAPVLKNNFVFLEIDVDNDKTGLTQKHKIRYLPTVLFFDAQGQLVKDVPGCATDVTCFSTVLRYISDQGYKKTSFVEYASGKR